MYEETKKQARGEHIEQAEKFAQFLVGSFDPIQQNEAIIEMTAYVRRKRVDRLEELKKEHEFLSMSLEKLNQF